MKKIINSKNAPKAIGCYNQAILADGLLFISGQIPMDSTTNQMVSDTIQNETRQVMKNLAAILTEANMSFDNVLKASIFIKDMEQFGEIDNVYSSFFNDYKPAREMVQVARLPKDVNVEISMIAKK